MAETLLQRLLPFHAGMGEWPGKLSAEEIVMDANGWRPIESLPKTEDKVILYGDLLTYCCSPSGRGEPFCKSVDVSYLRLGRWWVGVYECLPTHWMPIPPPPAQEGK